MKIDMTKILIYCVRMKVKMMICGGWKNKKKENDIEVVWNDSEHDSMVFEGDFSDEFSRVQEAKPSERVDRAETRLTVYRSP